LIYRKLPDNLPSPGPFVGELRKCRDAVTRASATVKPFGTVYQALNLIIVAIDGAAQVITGRRDYFYGHGSSATEGQLQARARERAWERGEGEL
jgi:O-glycosyl hydrolase